jgi:two-component system, chemotaxis family, sensor kinase CheA
MSLDNDQYKQLFIEEAKEHIENLTKCLLSLEKDSQNKEVINTLFRSAHTLKGSSGMMGYKDFQELTHSMEDVFDNMRKGKSPSSDLISILLECVDALSLRLNNIQNLVEGEIEVLQLKEKLHTSEKFSATEKKDNPNLTKNPEEKSITEVSKSEKDIITKAQSSGDPSYIVDLNFSKDCSFKSIRASMVISKIGELAEVVKTIPDQKELDEEKLSQGLKIFVSSKANEQALEKCARQILEVEQVTVHCISKEMTSKDSSPGVAVSEEAKVVSEVRSAQTVRVKFDQLDKLMNWVGELVINKIALLQVTADSKNEGLKRITENIDRLTADLQDLVMEVRMVPVSQVFDRFPRLVRDLSLKKGKKIELVMNGRDIEIDRTVLDEIGEPLIHLLRNSIDHGIETPMERESANKNCVGTIRLSAQRNGDHVIVEIEDDGAGIDPEKVKQSALKKGFITESEAEKMTTDKLVNLIFLPGFSTAKEITDTSGRGVGMDVVKTKISALGGTVQLETKVGKGTKTIIKLPLTLAIIQAILVNDSTQTFAIPTSQVSEIVQAQRSEIKSLGKTDGIVVRGHVIPVVHFLKLLGIVGEEEENIELVITYLGDENSKLGLAVDSVLRQQDILVKSLNGTLQGIKGVSGATILGDGQVVLVLDVGQFVSRTQKKTLGTGPELLLAQ